MNNKGWQVRLVTSLVSSAMILACSDDGNRSSSSSSGSSSGASGSSSSSSSSSGATSSGGVKPTEDVSGEITGSRTLSSSKDYLLKGLVRVKAGTTLTIEKGTTIRGAVTTDKTNAAILLVEAGAKIIAEGTADEPIVFTSQAAEGVRRAGDWGGIVILGNAPINVAGGKGNIEGILSTTSGTQYGGNNPDDSSGVLRYVRVEYVGYVLSEGNEVNGITFGGVGRGTKVDHVQVRHALDDCFEFFGGTVDAKYLACQYNQDDGFDFDNGYQGRIQFAVLQQDPNHPGEDNGIESDNDATGSAAEPFTNPQVYNVTLVGKNKSVDAVQYAMLLRRNSRGTYRNILALGFEAGVDVRDASTAAATKGGALSLSIANSAFFGSTGTNLVDNLAFAENGDAAPNKDNDGLLDEAAWLKTPDFKNLWADPGMDAPYNANAPKFGPINSVTSAATAPGDGFFDTKAVYVGAFKDKNDSWATEGKWAVWADK